MLLSEFMSRASDDYTYYIGASSGYFFIGSPAEYDRYIDRIERMAEIRLSEAEVKDYYRLTLDKTGVAVIVDAVYVGRAFSRDEFLAVMGVQNEKKRR